MSKRCGRAVDVAQSRTLFIAIFGIGILITEVTVLFLPAPRGLAVSLLRVFCASTISSIAGFAFSALAAPCFHLMDSPVYVVQVMITCSIAIRCSVSRRCGVRSTGRVCRYFWSAE